MTQLTDLEYLKLNKFQRFCRKFVAFFESIPGKFKNLGLSIWGSLKKAFWGIVNFFKGLGLTFWYGDWKTKV